MTHALSDLIETTARQLAAKVIAAPGWAGQVDAVCEALADMVKASGAPHPEALATRACAILREVAAEPMALVERYPDLLPPELRAVLLAEALAVIREAGATVEEFRDSASTPFLRLGKVEALGIPQEEMDRLNATAPGPVGPLHRVQ